MKRCILRFLARLLNAHYNSEYRERIVQLIVTTFAKSESVVERCQFIMFLEESIGLLDSATITSYFLHEFLDMLRKEKNPRVQKLFLKALKPLWETARVTQTQAIVEPLHDLAFSLEKQSWPAELKAIVIETTHFIRSSYEGDFLEKHRSGDESTKRLNKINQLQENASLWCREKAMREEFEKNMKNGVTTPEPDESQLIKESKQPP